MAADEVSVGADTSKDGRRPRMRGMRALASSHRPTLTSILRLRTFEALQFRDFRLLWLGQAAASSGQWMDQVTRGWLMYELTNSPLQLGLVSASRAIPLILFSVVAGAVADRHGRKAQLVIAQITNAVLNFVLAALVVTHHVRPWHVYATALLAGVVMSFQQPARQAMISDLVDEAHLANAVGLNSMVFNASRSVAPALAGVLIAAFDVGGSYILQGVIFVVATVWTVQMNVPDPREQTGHARGRGDGSILGSTIEGGRYIWANRAVRSVILIVLVPSFLGQPYTSLMPVFARDILHVGATGQGLLLTFVGLGALVGAFAVATVGNTGRQGLLMLLGAAIFGLALVGFSASPWFVVSLGLMALSGLCNVTYGTQANTLLQVHTPSAIRGRVMGVYFLSRGLVPLGSLVAGAMASALGAPHTVALMGGACALLALWMLVSAPDLRRMR